MPLSPRSNALIGGLPTPQTDLPICAVFIPIFLLGSLLNATLFFRNLRRKHKFIPSWLLNVFCLIRITTCSTRIAWAKDPTNQSLAVAAQVFNNAGVIFLYIINLLFAQRILRALQPGVGWNKGASVLVKSVFAGVVASLVMGITGLVISAGTTWERPRATTDPAWYDAKAAFYCFGFVLEVSIVALLTAARMDRRFYVPNGCKGPGDYSRPAEEGSDSDGTEEVAKEEGIALGKL
ncbi:family c-likeg- -coupled receptor protein [Rutstroemia sp. NJR-2017a BBW]|nr:family c-likeg- -coupled receptor protein [Rutstroemia sp. NJR-2017a BBW]